MSALNVECFHHGIDYNNIQFGSPVLFYTAHGVIEKLPNFRSIVDYYWNGNGNEKLKRYLTYQAFWHSDKDLPQPHLSCYEDLLVNCEDGVRSIFDYLEIDLLNEEIAHICKATNFFSFKEQVRGPGRHLRKGQAGDWVNHLTDDIVEDVKKHCYSTGFNNLFKQYF